MSKALGILGLAKKAGYIEIGEESAGIAARAKKARVLLTAGDAADNTIRRIDNYAERCGMPHIKLKYTKLELGTALGTTSCAALALTDIGMAASFAEKLEAESPGEYTEALEALETKSARILQRKKETLAHERNIRKGKHASSEQKGRKTNG